MKKIGFVVVVLILIVAVYSAIWYQKSNELKDRIENTISDLSKDPETRASLQYDKMERGGYPFSIDYIFTNPVLTEKATKSNIAHQGEVVIGSSVFNRDRIRITSKGKTEFIYNDSKSPQKHVMTGNVFLSCTGCVKNLKKIGEKIDSQKINEIGELVALLFKDDTLKLTDFSLIDATKNVLLFKGKEAYFHVDNQEKGDKTNHFSLELSLKGIDSKSFQSLSDLEKTFPGVSPDELQSAFNEEGSADLSFAAHGFIPSWDHPFYQQQNPDNIPPFLFVIDKLDSSSDLGWNKVSGKIQLERMSNEFKGLFNFENQAQVNEKYHERFVKIANVLAKSAASQATKKEHSDFALLFVKNSNDLVPDLAKWGKLETQLNLTGGGTISNNDIGNFTLHTLKCFWRCVFYEIEINGEHKDNNSGYFEITIKNYHQLITDLTDYYNKWQKIVNEAKMQSLPIITKPMVDRVIQFLESFDSRKDPKALDIKVTVEDPDHIKVGNKSLDEAQAEIIQLSADLQKEMDKANPPKPAS